MLQFICYNLFVTILLLWTWSLLFSRSQNTVLLFIELRKDTNLCKYVILLQSNFAAVFYCQQSGRTRLGIVHCLVSNDISTFSLSGLKIYIYFVHLMETFNTKQTFEQTFEQTFAKKNRWFNFENEPCVISYEYPFGICKSWRFAASNCIGR